MHIFFIVILTLISARAFSADFTKHLGTWLVNYDMTLKVVEDSKLSSEEKAKHKKTIDLLRLTGGSGFTFRADTAAEFSGMKWRKDIAFYPYEIDVIDDRTIRAIFRDRNRKQVSQGILRFEGECFYAIEEPNKEPRLKEYYCRVEPNPDEVKVN